MDGCIDPGHGLYVEITSAALDGSYLLTGGGGAWTYTSSGDYVEAKVYGEYDPSCSAASPPTETVDSLTISVSCAGGVMYVSVSFNGDTLGQVSGGSGGPPPVNPMTITTTTIPTELSFVMAGSITLSW
jgi:hypothetical protein